MRQTQVVPEFMHEGSSLLEDGSSMIGAGRYYGATAYCRTGGVPSRKAFKGPPARGNQNAAAIAVRDSGGHPRRIVNPFDETANFVEVWTCERVAKKRVMERVCANAIGMPLDVYI